MGRFKGGKFDRDRAIERFARMVREHQVSNVSQTDLAKLWQVSQPTVHSYLHGERLPPTPLLLRICDECDVSVLWLLLDLGPKRLTSLRLALSLSSSGFDGSPLVEAAPPTDEMDDSHASMPGQAAATGDAVAVSVSGEHEPGV